MPMERPRALLLAAAASLAPLVLGLFTLPYDPVTPPTAAIYTPTAQHTPVPPLACDEDSTLLQLMAEAGHIDAFLQARIREPVPDPPSIIPAVENLKVLAEWARERPAPAVGPEMSPEDWAAGFDDLLAKLDAFEDAVATGGANSTTLNTAYLRVTQSCTACHDALEIMP